MTVLLIVAAILVVIALLPVGVALRYDEDGFFLFLRVAFLRLQILPSSKEKDEKAEKKPKKKKEKPPQAEDHKKKGGPLQFIRACLPLVKPALEGVRRRLTIRRLRLRVVWAASDPADAAMGYAYANAALGVLWPVLFQNFRIRDHELDVGVDFDAAQPTLLAGADMTMTVFQALTLGLPLLFRFLKIYRTVQAAPEKGADTSAPGEPGQKTVKKEAQEHG